MRSGFLSFLGIGKPKNTDFKFSDALFGGIAKVKALDAADASGIEKAVGEVMAHVVQFGDSEAKELLAGAVSDCLKNTEAVLARKDDVSKKIDELYGKCQDADSDAVKRVLDAGEKKEDKEKSGEGEKKEDKKDDDKKKEGTGEGSSAKDFDSVIASAIDKAFVKMGENIDTKIDAAVKKALGAVETQAADSRPADAADAGGTDEDVSYLVQGIFGNR